MKPKPKLDTLAATIEESDGVITVRIGKPEKLVPENVSLHKDVVDVLVDLALSLMSEDPAGIEPAPSG